VIHSNAIDKANALAEKVKEELDVEPIVTPFSALIAVHLGEGAVAIGFIPKK
jgi:fatty acid-binding protein DegV